MTDSDIAKLRERVRAEVVATLRQSDLTADVAAASASHHLLLLFMGREEPPGDFLAQIADLSQRQYSFSAAFSYSFKRFFKPEEVMRQLPGNTEYLASNCERELLSVANRCEGLLAPGISLNTAAKIARGMDDSIPTFHMTQMICEGKLVVIARDIAQMGRALRERRPNAPPAWLQTAEKPLHDMARMGVRFAPVVELAAVVADAFHIAPNETPARLARQRPVTKREFVTAEDVIRAQAMNQKTLTHSPDAIVTSEAREHAERIGIALQAE
ncbi:MAG: hypothetical protein NTY46_01505 [Candidatus Sumerlaeota bacterium]|nr:hypothetical protein [Candidatus Sumerlaeota bacterium]